MCAKIIRIGKILCTIDQQWTNFLKVEFHQIFVRKGRWSPMKQMRRRILRFETKLITRWVLEPNDTIPL